jgi:antitoxin component YwqK of YwqJK toxin-antitoxin module
MRYSLLLFFIMITLISCVQKGVVDMYNLRDYDEIKRGEIEIDGVLIPNGILLQNRNDTNYTAKLTFEDSLYKNPITKFFFYKNTANGPCENYIDGRVFMKGYFKNGKRHGEEITYGEHYIRSKEYWRDGTKTGTWEEYDEKGRLISKTVFDNNGKVTEQQSSKTGK